MVMKAHKILSLIHEYSALLSSARLMAGNNCCFSTETGVDIRVRSATMRFNWPPAYDNLSYSITVPWISLNFNDPSYGMLRVLRCMHFIHLLPSFSLLRARGLSTFARRFSRTIHPSIDRFFFLSIAHSLPFLFLPLLSFLFDTLVSPLDYSFKRTTILLNPSPSRFTRLDFPPFEFLFEIFFLSNSNNFLAFV